MSAILPAGADYSADYDPDADFDRVPGITRYAPA